MKNSKTNHDAGREGYGLGIGGGSSDVTPEGITKLKSGGGSGCARNGGGSSCVCREGWDG